MFHKMKFQNQSGQSTIYKSYTAHICTACKVLQNITGAAVRVRAVQINVRSVQDGK